MLQLSQEDTISEQRCQCTRCKVLHHILTASTMYMPSFGKIKSDPAQLSACLMSSSSSSIAIPSPKETFQPTVAMAAIVAIAPTCTIGTRFYHLPSTVVPCKAESHLPSSLPKPLLSIWNWEALQMAGLSSWRGPHTSSQGNSISGVALPGTHAGCQPHLQSTASQGFMNLASPLPQSTSSARNMWWLGCPFLQLEAQCLPFSLPQALQFSCSWGFYIIWPLAIWLLSSF